MTTQESIKQKLLSNHLNGLLPEGLIAPDYGSYSIDSIPSFIRSIFGERTERGRALMSFFATGLATAGYITHPRWNGLHALDSLAVTVS